MKHVRRFPIRTLAAALALAGASLARPAHACCGPEPAASVQGQAVTVQVLVDHGAAPLWLSPRGDARRYFEAFAGRNYSLVVRNTTGQRIGVLISVDGLNVVSGERSHLSPDERMYVLGPWETATIEGWRTSLDEVRRFVFVDERRSYAQRTGQANGDMGWIRVLAFREKQPWWAVRMKTSENVPGRPTDDRNDLHGPVAAAPPTLAPAPSAGDGGARDLPAPSAAPPAAQSPQAAGELESMRQEAKDGLARSEKAGSFPGTGWGDRRSDPVRLVEFTADRCAADNLAFRYEYASGLRALGIDPDGNGDRDRLRDRDNGELGFAKPPRW